MCDGYISRTRFPQSVATKAPSCASFEPSLSSTVSSSLHTLLQYSQVPCPSRYSNCSTHEITPQCTPTASRILSPMILVPHVQLGPDAKRPNVIGSRGSSFDQSGTHEGPLVPHFGMSQNSRKPNLSYAFNQDWQAL